ncbi:MAG: membrane protein insertion efficiency factor YidD [Candidatus Accumulibacter sp.]|uniref:membrane protein insertion efficiency factor YidD n=1 Tax=Accumulibacter sp. TaxID=2053492 RepID=UPI0019FAFCA2|nr:membrane protein insertion efficiency factor YidD [Accumulibacter sp.]MBE2257867.1 membrane protein insertion efficiency factor YidD [Paracoccaceae bacterium]MCB1940741.1 membrane protein insertion efficiency factor YidD [Accumulibacter sp.]MCP5247181.1 membrane protein insertion efficiency factor YidD [Accumulibacter sp.]
MKKLLLVLIGFYRYAISPMLGRRCRFFPSCSEYAMEAVEKHGPGKGARLALQRLVRCHPWNVGGFDPVP